MHKGEFIYLFMVQIGSSLWTWAVLKSCAPMKDSRIQLPKCKLWIISGQLKEPIQLGVQAPGKFRNFTNYMEILGPNVMGIRSHSKVNIRYFNPWLMMLSLKYPYFKNKHLKNLVLLKNSLIKKKLLLSPSLELRALKLKLH